MISFPTASPEAKDEPSLSLPPGHTLICFSHLRWNFDFRRPQQLMGRFARSGRVIYWEAPEAAAPECEPALGVRTCAETDVVVVTPSLPEMLSDADQTAALRDLLGRFLAKEAGPLIHWYCDPAMLSFTRGVRSVFTIYDRVVAPPEACPALERQLIEIADIVFSGELRASRCWTAAREAMQTHAPPAVVTALVSRLS